MISEMQKSIKAILYERVTSPLSGIFILVWLLFNWKLCLVLTLGNNEISDRIAFVELNYININNNLYYPLFYTLAFIVIYPWISLGPFYIWQRANFHKNKIKNAFDSKTQLTIEQSVELRREIRQKEIEFAEMLSAKNSKQVELESENQHLHKLLDEAETKFSKAIEELEHEKARMNKNKATETFDYSQDEQKWNKEYTEVYKFDSEFMHSLGEILEYIVNDKRVDSSVKKYCLAQGLITIANGGRITLTSKGEYLSRFTNSNWEHAF